MSPTPNIFDQVQQLLGDVSSSTAEAEIERLGREVEEKRAEIQKWYALLGLKQQLGDAGSNGHQGSQDTLPLRRAVRIIFEERAEGSTLAVADLRGELLRRRWLDDDKRDNNRLYMTVSNMVKRGELVRPAQGLYKLPPEG
jgi:hypothetical protein